jgi:hypothetical protein
MAEPRLQAIEARIWALLEPYRGELEAATIYGMPSIRWPGAKAHDYFASVRSGKSYVSLYLLVADAYPEALEGTPPALLKRRSGKAAFTFQALDDDMKIVGFDCVVSSSRSIPVIASSDPAARMNVAVRHMTPMRNAQRPNQASASHTARPA